jgi:probable rRNA maturation factor
VRVAIVAPGIRDRIPRRWLARAARTAMRATRRGRRAEVEIAIVSDTAIARLNRRFLRHRGATDVITFQGTGLAGDRSIGEVVVSVDRARAQARRMGCPLRTELATLVVHGILHLGGYDDHRKSDAAKMHARQDAIVRRLRRR